MPKCRRRATRLNRIGHAARLLRVVVKLVVYGVLMRVVSSLLLLQVQVGVAYREVVLYLQRPHPKPLVPFGLPRLFILLIGLLDKVRNRGNQSDRPNRWPSLRLPNLRPTDRRNDRRKSLNPSLRRPHQPQPRRPRPTLRRNPRLRRTRCPRRPNESPSWCPLRHACNKTISACRRSDRNSLSRL